LPPSRAPWCAGRRPTSPPCSIPIFDVAITGRLIFHSQQVRELEVRLFGTTAVATMLLDDHYTVDGRDIIETYHALSVFTFTDGRWLWAGGQAMAPRAPWKSS
jgi:hypothetical protein